MKIVIGADHHAMPLKQTLVDWLAAQGHDVQDIGHHGGPPDEAICDYADAVCEAVTSAKAERGVLLCMSGGFMNIRANKWPTIRCVMGINPLSVAHDRAASNANVLALAAAYTDAAHARACVDAFLSTPFEPLERRLKRLKRLEEKTG